MRPLRTVTFNDLCDDALKHSGAENSEKQAYASVLPSSATLQSFLPHFLLSIHTGICMSERYGMRWNQLNFERRQFHLEQFTKRCRLFLAILRDAYRDGDSL
jgi:hypothetical protein